MCFINRRGMSRNDNAKFSQLSYWDSRYQDEEESEWLGGYDRLKGLLEPLLSPDDQILILGCGNSSMGADLYRNGYHWVTNVDYSALVIEKMREKCGQMPQMKWICRDILKPMGFGPESFDVVLEKATIDAFLVEERDPWRMSQHSQDLIDGLLQQISCILRPNGKFLSVTFAQPHFRLPLYAQGKYGWDVDKQEFGEEFSYFLYTMTKGKPLQLDQIAKYLQIRPIPTDVAPVTLCENDVFNIGDV